MKKLLYLLIIVLVIGCSTVPVTESKDIGLGEVYLGGTNVGGYNTYISRFIDDELGTVCYLSRGMSAGGISCIPLKDLE